MKVGSLGSYLKTITNKNITIFGIPDTFVLQGKREELLKELELDTNSIYKKIKNEIRKAK